MVIGGLALGAFAGCSDDDPVAPPPVDEDTGTLDTGSTDTARPDVASETATDTGTDTGPFKADRAATLVFASPDLGGKLVCLAAFLDGTDETMTDPFQSLPSTGAIGIPDSTAPTDTTKTIAFPYGAVVPIPLSDLAQAALENFNVVAYLVDTNPAAAGKTCKDVWKEVRGDTWRWKKLAPKSIKTGEHGIIAFQGCRNAATANGACGATGSNFKIELRKAAMTKPTEAGANIGFQFLHLSQFGGFTIPGVGDAGATAVPGFQSVDIYIKPGPATADSDAGTDGGDGGDAATAPALIKVAENVSYDGAITALKGFTLPAGVKNADSFLVVAPRVASGGTASFPCSNSTPQPAPTCPNWTLPLAPFFSMSQGYQLVGGGLEFPNTNQVIMLSGSPIEPLADGGMGAPSLRIPFARAASWM
jgi:hypothetical protein